MRKIYRAFQRRFIRIQSTIEYRLRYGSDAPPLTTVINVNPSEITHFVYPGFYQRSTFPRIRGGDWDKMTGCDDIRAYDSDKGQSLFPFQNYDLYQSMYNHFVHGYDWSDTEFYSIAVDKIKKGKSYWHGCTTIEDIENRCEYIDQLYVDMIDNGYRSASQDLNRSPQTEVVVDITRDGEIVMDDGRHRLIIAKILNIDTIPVWVLVRHEQWQDIRWRLYRANGTSKLNDDLNRYIAHPDIKYDDLHQ